jgi:hypothetical protein
MNTDLTYQAMAHEVKASRIERLERLRVLPKGFENPADFIVVHIPSIHVASAPGFGACRPTTRCIAASVETCSFTL